MRNKQLQLPYKTTYYGKKCGYCLLIYTDQGNGTWVSQFLNTLFPLETILGILYEQLP